MIPVTRYGLRLKILALEEALVARFSRIAELEREVITIKRQLEKERDRSNPDPVSHHEELAAVSGRDRAYQESMRNAAHAISDGANRLRDQENANKPLLGRGRAYLWHNVEPSPES